MRLKAHVAWSEPDLMTTTTMKTTTEAMIAVMTTTALDIKWGRIM